jgi:hypothetical protein
MSVHDYIGTIHGTLRITGIAARGERNEAVFLAECLQCKTRDVPIPLRKIVQGNAVCTSSLHRHTSQPAPTSTAASHPLVEAEIARHNAERRAEREESARRWREQQQRLAEQYRRYKLHMIVELGFDISELPAFDVWAQATDAARERIMAAIEQEN